MDLNLDLDLGTLVPLLVDPGTPTDYQRARDHLGYENYSVLHSAAAPILRPSGPPHISRESSYASSIQSQTETLYLRIHPDPQNPLKRIITTVLSPGEEEPNLAAQRLWDMEQQAQREMGTEKFLTHTFMMPPLDIPKTETFLIVEFVDSGRKYKYENCCGVSQWNFQPLLGGVNYWRGEGQGRGNLYGFKPKMHDFFCEMLVPVTLRTYRSLMALLDLRDPFMICDEAEEMHEHYPIKIALNPDVKGNPEFTKHLVCGNTEIAVLFEVLANPYEDQKGFMLSRISSNNSVTNETLTYVQACENRRKLEEIGFPRGFTLYLLALFWHDDSAAPGSPMSID